MTKADKHQKKGKKMTQFAICVGNKPTEESMGVIFRKLNEGELLYEAAQSILGKKQPDKTWTFEDKSTKLSDTLFTEAQKEMTSGKCFSQTRLANIIEKACDVCTHIYLFYGTDWENLNKAYSCMDLKSETEKSLQDGFAEVYIEYTSHPPKS